MPTFTKQVDGKPLTITTGSPTEAVTLVAQGFKRVPTPKSADDEAKDPKPTAKTKTKTKTEAKASEGGK